MKNDELTTTEVSPLLSVPKHQTCRPCSCLPSPSPHHLSLLLLLQVSFSLLHHRSSINLYNNSNLIINLYFSINVIFFSLTDNSKTANSKSVKKLRSDWREKSRPIPAGGTYPAKDHCRFSFSLSSIY